MKCLKCGRETDQTFCEICRAEMEKYPVKPGAIIQLPKERTPIRKPTPRYARVSLESVVKAQKKTIRRMGRAIAILVAVMAVMTAFLIRLLGDDEQMPLGKNYSTVTRPVAESDVSTEAPPLPEPIDGTAAPAAFTRSTAPAVQPSETGK